MAEKIIKLEKEQLNGLICFEDLYKVLGMYDYFYKNGGFVKSVEQIKANEKTLDNIHKAFQENIVKSKDPRIKEYRKKQRLSMESWDFLCYSPMIDNTVPDMTIKLVDTNDK